MELNNDQVKVFQIIRAWIAEILESKGGYYSFYICNYIGSASDKVRVENPDAVIEEWELKEQIDKCLDGCASLGCFLDDNSPSFANLAADAWAYGANRARLVWLDHIIETRALTLDAEIRSKLILTAIGE